MKKLFLLFAILIGVAMASNSWAISIPEAESAGDDGPFVWFVPVKSTLSASAGDVVVWDISTSTGKNDNLVTTTTTADTYIVAGVVYGSSISASGVGLMAVHGVVPVNNLAGTLTAAGGLACSSGTAGKARGCTTEAANFGIVTTASTGTSSQVYVRGLQ